MFIDGKQVIIKFLLNLEKMYKVNINPSYFQHNLKINQQIKDNNTKSKAKFLLTEQQKQFIEMHLPPGYKINIASEIDQKRNRIPKKTDAQFESYFSKKQDKKQYGTSEKKNEKKQEKRAKDRQQIGNNYEQQIKYKKIQEEVPAPHKHKQSQISKKNSKYAQIQYELDKKIEGKSQQIEKQFQKKPQPKQQSSKNQKIERATSDKKTEQIIINKKQQQKMKSEINVKQNTLKQQILLVKNQPTQIKDEILPYQQTFQRRPSQIFSSEQKQFCLRLVNKLRVYKSSWPFRLPVDPINQGVPNYLEVIHQPMDLKTIQKKINSNKYQHIAQFHGDINKIFLNSYKFNPKETNYYTLTMQLESYYHQLLKQIQKNPNALEYDRSGRGARGKPSSKNEQDFVQEQTTKKGKLSLTAPLTPIKILPQISPIIPNNIQVKQKVADVLPKTQNVKPKKKRFSDVDRKELLKKVKKLSSKALESVVQIAFGQVDDQKTTFYLDFCNLTDEAFTKIQQIVRLDQEKPEDLKCNFIGTETRMMLF